MGRIHQHTLMIHQSRLRFQRRDPPERRPVLCEPELRLAPPWDTGSRPRLRLLGLALGAVLPLLRAAPFLSFCGVLTLGFVGVARSVLGFLRCPTARPRLRVGSRLADPVLSLVRHTRVGFFP